MLSEQKMSMKLLLIGVVLLIAAVKGESPGGFVGVQLCNHNFHHFLLQTFITFLVLNT